MIALRVTFLLLFAVSVPAAALHATDAVGGFVRPGMKVAELRDTKDRVVTASTGADRTGVSWPEGVWGRLGVAGLLVALVLGGCVACGRRLRRASSPGGECALEVVSRVSLSPKHSVVLLRARGHEIVVGVAGDRIQLLSPVASVDAGRDTAVLDVAAEPPPALEAQSVTEALEPEGVDDSWARDVSWDGALDAHTCARPDEADEDFLPGSSSSSRNASSAPAAAPSGNGLLDRAEDLQARLTVGPLCGEGLDPYRRQVDRLRSLLDGWKATVEPTDRSDGQTTQNETLPREVQD